VEQSGWEKLEALLLQALTPFEVRRVLTRCFGDAARGALPSNPGAPEAFAARVVALIRRKRWATPALFARLLAAAPRWQPEVEAIARDLSVALRRAGPPRGVRPPPSEVDLDAPAAPPLRGGRLVPTAELGRGSFAVVYRAWHLDLGRWWAVKILRPHLAAEQGRSAVARFHREAAVMADLDHPRVVRVHNMFIDDDGRMVIAMPCYDRGNLAQRIDANGRLGWEEAATLAVDLLEALACVHLQGIVHRDVRPQNVLMDGDDRAVLCDFGVARILDADTLRSRTIGGGAVGFLAPEQIRAPQTVDPRTDLYGVAATLAATLHGDLRGGDLSHPRERQRLLGAVPPPLRAIIEKATEYDLADRYPDATAMSAALRALLTPEALPPESPALGVVALFIGAVALDGGPLPHVAIEQREIEAAWRDRGGVASLPAARRLDLMRTFADQSPRVVHFSGHGTRRELMVLGRDGRTEPLAPETLRDLLAMREERGGRVEVLVLNACDSAGLAERLASDAIAVVGVEGLLDDRVSLAFARAFHRALVATPDDVEAAVASAREAARAVARRRDYRLFPRREIEAREETAEVQTPLDDVAARPARSDAEASPGSVQYTALSSSHPLELSYIPGGVFSMGSPPGLGDGDEHPRHRVRLSRAYLLGVTPVTQGQWGAAVAAGRSRGWSEGLKASPSHFSGERRPVERVSWYDAVRWCNLLSLLEGLEPVYEVGDGERPSVSLRPDAVGFRLPTEAEWERACRAGGEEAWCFGDEEGLLGEYAWFSGNSGRETQPVRGKRPNDWGLFDVHGNVWEWCWDAWHRAYTSGEVVDPVEVPESDGSRLVRGGSFISSPNGCRSGGRSGLGAWDRVRFLGFRVALSWPPPPDDG